MTWLLGLTTNPLVLLLATMGISACMIVPDPVKHGRASAWLWGALVVLSIAGAVGVNWIVIGPLGLRPPARPAVPPQFRKYVPVDLLRAAP